MKVESVNFNEDQNPKCDKNSKKQLWTASEDSRLVQLVELHGAYNWTNIAVLMPGRTNKQCHNRWTNCLNPDNKKGVWSAEEDKTLLDMYKIVGKHWSKISMALSGRNPLAVKNRFFSLQSYYRKRSHAFIEEQDESIGAINLISETRTPSISTTREFVQNMTAISDMSYESSESALKSVVSDESTTNSADSTGPQVKKTKVQHRSIIQDQCKIQYQHQQLDNQHPMADDMSILTHDRRDFPKYPLYDQNSDSFLPQDGNNFILPTPQLKPVPGHPYLYYDENHPVIRKIKESLV